ncbi:tetratricopeptide repeat protein [Thermogemmatispora sp.]|uniref:tetratricopeptide repeat protein n=1 Tax=Thermogemmatispora sp. TaxID=1968838 RepID=UPI0035E45180
MPIASTIAHHFPSSLKTIPKPIATTIHLTSLASTSLLSPKTARIQKNNLAVLYHHLGRLTDALSLLKRSLAACERILGPQHPTTQQIRENYEDLQRQQ